MKTLILIAAISLLSCSKSNSKKMEELKAVAEYTVSGKTITFKSDKSSANTVAYGYQLEIDSPTQSTVVYSPFSSFRSTELRPFKWYEINATVTKSGEYKFRLTTYDADGKSNFVFINVTVN